MPYLNLLYTLDLFGTIVFAASGALIAREQRRNGCYAVLYAVLTAVGGGTLRDILLAEPVFWVRSPLYLWLAATVGLLIYTLSTTVRIRRQHLWVADTLSLAIFSIVGTQVLVASPAFTPTSLAHWILPPLMGLLTGVGGGLVRDIIVGEPPMVMQGYSLALASLMSGSLYVLLTGAHVPSLYVMGIAIAAAFLCLPIPAHLIVKRLPAYRT